MNSKFIVIGAFLAIAGIGGLFIKFGETPFDIAFVIIGAIAIYLGAKVL